MTVALRPRNQWEAMDLGFGMARTWWKPIWGAWLAVVLPIAVLINALCWEVQWLAPLLIWWLKPLFDRIPLYVLSHAAFGDTPGIAQTVRGVLPLWRKSLAWDLSFGRFDFARSFNMPVRDLEGLRGKQRRQRLHVLQKQTRSGAVWLTLVCLHLELVLNIGLFALLYLLWPHDNHINFSALFFAPNQNAWLEVLQHVFYLTAMTVMEPFYIAAGFALYLNRRTLLEGWDIEIAFRRMAQRHPVNNSAGALMMSLLAGALLVGLVVPHPALAGVAPRQISQAAAPTPGQLKQKIAGVLKQPEFRTEKTGQHWKYTGKPPAAKPVAKESAWRKWLESLIPGLARFAEAVLWLLLAAAVIWLLVKRKYWLGWFNYTPKARPAVVPRMLFGLDIQPQLLPDNIPAVAWQLWQAGQHRDAMSLLYRGALARWVARDAINLSSNATEGDCMRLFRAASTPDAGDYFCQLTQAWQHTAYAGRQPHPDAMQQLCRGWDNHFGVAR